MLRDPGLHPLRVGGEQTIGLMNKKFLISLIIIVTFPHNFFLFCSLAQRQ